ncbi:GSCOCG00011323001-RA-CDS [Cotesia congregata]|nr:GSCOCG00011323001-RA-CDS [Cotesia congregata]
MQPARTRMLTMIRMMRKITTMLIVTTLNLLMFTAASRTRMSTMIRMMNPLENSTISLVVVLRNAKLVQMVIFQRGFIVVFDARNLFIF